MPACDAVMVQLPGLESVTVAVEAPPSATEATDWLPIAQVPVALKFTCSPFATPPERAVAVTVTAVDGFVIATELGNEPIEMVWSFSTTAGGDGALWRGVGSITGIGSRVVDIV